LEATPPVAHIRSRLFPINWPHAGQYAFALITVALAISLRWLLDPWLDERLAFGVLSVVLLPLVVLVRPGPFLVAAATGWTASWYFFVSPRVSLRIHNAAEALLMATFAAGLAAACVAAWLARRAQERDLAELTRAEGALARRVAEQEALYRLTDGVHRSSTLEELFDTALTSIRAALGCDRASILLFDDQSVMGFVASRGLSDNYRRRTTGHSPWSRTDGSPTQICVEDVARSDVEEPLKEVILNEGIRALAFIPLLSQGTLLGKFMVYYDAPHAFSPSEMDLALTMARQLAFGIERKQGEAQRHQAAAALQESEAQHKRLTNRLKLLLGSTSALIRSLKPEDLMGSVLEVARELVMVDGYAIWRADPAGTWSVAGSVGLSKEFLARTLQATPSRVPTEPIIVQPQDLLDHSTPLLRERWESYDKEGIRSLMILPLYIHGNVTGTLVFYCRNAHAFSDVEVESAQAMANIAAAALTTSELYEAQLLNRQKAEEAALRESFVAAAGAILAQSLDYQTTLANVARAAVPEFADWCAVDLADEGGDLRRLAVAHVNPEKIALAQALHDRRRADPDRQSGAARVMDTGQPEMMSDIPVELIRQAAKDPEHLRLLLQADIRSYICVPLRAQGGVVGTMTFVAGEAKRRFDGSDLAVAEEIGRRAGQAIDNASLYGELREREEALREADRRKDEFLATLAHELRNPLAPIRNALEIMRRTVGEGHAAANERQIVQRQTEQLVRLVDDLLDVSRITRDRLELRKTRVELAPILKQAVEACQPMPNGDRHRIYMSLPSQPLYLDADAVRLGQVFSNLMNNACKFTPPGAPIHVTAQAEGSEAVIRVQDSGIGIPPEQFDRIFEMFTRLDQTLERSQSGLGIGLTLAKRLIELHDGRISVHSEGAGRGAEFFVRLPLAIEASLPAARRQPGEGEAMAPTLQGLKILVVDDNVDAAKTLARLLRMSGAATELAHDGISAVECADRFRPQLILLDIGLPQLNGYEVCRRIRREPWGGEPAIVAVTGWGQEEDRLKSQEAGFDAHLVKPLDPQTLNKVLVDFMKGRNPPTPGLGEAEAVSAGIR
jgi:K+-sensing histidine kinase KdpD/ActR/RegA family two-component response regulator